MGVGRFNAGVKFCDEVASHPVGGGGGRQGLEVEQKYSYSIHICYRSGKKSGFEIGGGGGGGRVEILLSCHFMPLKLDMSASLTSHVVGM